MLEESGESTSVERRHARFFCELLESIYAAPPRVAGREPWSEHAAYLTNVRSALQWAHRQKDETSLMSRLAAAAGPFLLDLSLLNDSIRWTEIGLEALDDSERGRSDVLEPQLAEVQQGISPNGGMFARHSSMQSRQVTQTLP
jgi:predicted ATPase